MNTDLFQQVLEANGRIDGWCEPSKSLTLASIIVATRPNVSIEIGLWKGKSFSAMALAHKAINNGICIGVDAWSKEVAVREQTSNDDRKWWADVDFESVRMDFLKNMQDLDVEKFIRIERRESRLFNPPAAIGLLSVDGSHSDTAMNDMMRFGSRVVTGGFVVTDDTNWTGGGVARGEQRLLEMGFRKLFCVGTGAVFIRIR